MGFRENLQDSTHPVRTFRIFRTMWFYPRWMTYRMKRLVISPLIISTIYIYITHEYIYIQIYIYTYIYIYMYYAPWCWNMNPNLCPCRTSPSSTVLSKPAPTEHPCPAGMFIVGSDEHCAEPGLGAGEIARGGPKRGPKCDKWIGITMDDHGLLTQMLHVWYIYNIFTYIIYHTKDYHGLLKDYHRLLRIMVK